MGVVLVVEPEASQAEPLLRALRKRVRAESFLVASTAAAIEVMDRGLPDLILVSALLSPKDEDLLMAHLRTLDGAAHLQTLTIPRLASGSRTADDATPVLGRFRKKKGAAPARSGCDPKLFAEEVTAHLARAIEIRSQPQPESAFRPGRIEAPVEMPVEMPVEAPLEAIMEPMADVEYQPLAVDAAAFVETSEEPEFTSAPFEARVEPDLWPAVIEASTEPVFTSASRESQEEADFTSAILASLKESDFNAAMVESQPGPEVSPPFVAASIAPVSPSPVATPFESNPEPDFDFALIESALMESALATSQSQPEPKPPIVESHIFAWLTDRAPLGIESSVTPPAAAEPMAAPPVVEEAVAEVVEEIKAEPEDLLERLARRFGFGSEMLRVAEVDAPPALPSGIASVRTQSEPAVWHAPPEPEPQAPSAERMAAQVAAVQAEAKATLAAELERVRAEGEARRLAELARLQAEADVLRGAAIAEARATAEREARDALAWELTRVRSEAEGVFAADLARVRTEVEQKLSAQVGEAETRLAMAEEARSAAEAAAAAALETEVARVRGEAEGRLQAELERIRRDAETARAIEQSDARHATEQMREAAAHEARVIAEDAARRTLEVEIARVRLQADTFLETEVARVQSEAHARQTAELEELRREMAEIRETAAKAAAEQSADYYKIWQLPPAPVEPPRPIVAEEPSDAGVAWPERYLPWAKWALPIAACLLLVAGNGIVIDTFASFLGPSQKVVAVPLQAAPAGPPVVAEKTSGQLKVESTPVGARLLVDGRNYGETPLTISDLQPGVHTLVLRTKAGSVTRRLTIRAGQTTVASEAIFAGWLAIFSPIPLTVSLNGKAAQVAEDGRILAAPGSYKVDLANERFNYHHSETMDVRPGELTARTISVPAATVRVVAPDGAEIRVDGAAAGKAPLVDLSMPIGTHEITATLPDRTERTATVAVRHGEITEARLEFGR